MNPSPSPNGSNGAATAITRDSNGRFVKGNAGGPGNPHARRVGELRSHLMQALSDDDWRIAITALVAKAKQGDLAAIKELLDRTLGRPTEADLIERIEMLEYRLQQEVTL